MEENKENNQNEKKTGFTVSELEGTAKKYASEIGLGVIFAMTAIFTLIWGGAMMVWSIILAMILAIIGAVVPGSMMSAISKSLDYVYRERVMLIITGVVLLVVAIFIPVLIFALVGLISGGSLSLSMKKKSCKSCCKTENKDSKKDGNSSS
ncbi:MAG: hypothetical protein SP4CHLAM5_06790 [Chlamydiia bacterium]|nr:hypothetical protein [Chlamydiia bacterium]MCH9618546.1 hypothetical protein [Chlamydiia bacterium]MCH9624254.1 hypothetical protein [Chlamydiia bacterium]